MAVVDGVPEKWGDADAKEVLGRSGWPLPWDRVFVYVSGLGSFMPQADLETLTRTLNFETLNFETLNYRLILRSTQ